MIRLLRDQVLLRKAIVAEKDKGGIIIPEIAQQPSYEGVVVAVGPNVQDLNIGDYVLYERNFGTPIPHKGEELWELTEDQIVCVLGDYSPR